jgi:hypothetical protein
MLNLTEETIVMSKPIKLESGMFQRDTFYPGGVHEREVWRPHIQHTYNIRGPLAAVKARVEVLMTMWPSAGYGTRSEVLGHAEGGDEVLVRVTRSHSCD